MDLRTRMLDAAEGLLGASPDRDISTRAVCEAVGVGAPALYRLFGDKNGLLKAVVDHGFDRYLSAKRALEPSADPVADLRNGWDTHVAFAREHSAVYRMMYSPAFSAVPDAAHDALQLLRKVLVRCAAAGWLRADVDEATQTIMSANIGVALSVVSQPDEYTDPKLSDRVRDAVHRAVLDLGAPPQSDPADAIPAVSRQLAALLHTHDTPLTGPETALLLQWLDLLAGASDRLAT